MTAEFSGLLCDLFGKAIEGENNTQEDELKLNTALRYILSSENSDYCDVTTKHLLGTQMITDATMAKFTLKFTGLDVFVLFNKETKRISVGTQKYTDETRILAESQELSEYEIGQWIWEFAGLISWLGRN